VIASMTDMYKFAHGEFGLLGSYTLTLYPFHERGLPLWCAIFRRRSCGRSSAPCSKRPVSARFYANPIIACSARSPR
jgi:branched-chain amino acid transport system permease protein